MDEAQGVSTRVELKQVSEADRIRTEQREARRATTRRRHGNNGSRKWGTQDSFGWHDTER
jgi:hypothetical protein